MRTYKNRAVPLPALPACVRLLIDGPHGCRIRRVRTACIVPALLAAMAVSGCDASSALTGDTEGRIAIVGDPERGLRVLGQYQCGSCHSIPGVPASRGVNGPTLDAFGKRSYIAGRVPNSAAALTRWIVAPKELVPDTTMPSMGVSPNDARDMAAYLGTLR